MDQIRTGQISETFTVREKPVENIPLFRINGEKPGFLC